MSEIVENYQEEQQLEEQKAPEYSFATIGGVYDDGLALIFPGAEEESEKHYRANLYCKFAKGQRVYLAKDSGTYVVLFPIGVPGSKEIKADSATTATTATKADSATTATSANTANSATKADTATKANSATTADTAAKADSATTADTAAKADSATKADTAAKADSATKADTATRATSADKLYTARKISLTGGITGSTTFDGSKDVSIATSANVASADKLTTARRITLSGAMSGTATFDGSKDITISTTASNVTAINFTTRHTGTTLAFFNQTAQSRKTLAKSAGTPTVTTLQTKLNELITDLISYGLFR